MICLYSVNSTLYVCIAKLRWDVARAVAGWTGATKDSLKHSFLQMLICSGSGSTRHLYSKLSSAQVAMQLAAHARLGKENEV